MTASCVAISAAPFASSTSSHSVTNRSGASATPSRDTNANATTLRISPPPVNASRLAARGLDGLRHDPTVLADLAIPFEPELLVGGQRPVDEESGGYRRGVLGVALDGSPTRLGDQLDRTGQRGTGDTLAPIPLAHEATGDPP